ncbi:MAG: hypothetical protein WC538_24240 [Thermoanaerobaculia bacterium]|jgi:hypothetical protein
MLNCADVRDRLQTLTRVDLRQDDQLRLHVAQCAACASADRAAQVLDDSLREAVLRDSVPTHDVRQAVLRRIDRAEPREGSRAFILRVAAALLLVLAGVGTWLVYRSVAPFEALARRHHQDEVVSAAAQEWITEPEGIAGLIGERIDASPAGARAVVANHVYAGRICRVGDARLVHLLATDGRGPVSIFICRDTRRRDLHASDDGSGDGLHSAVMASVDLTVVVVGPISENDANRLAKTAWSALTL